MTKTLLLLALLSAPAFADSSTNHEVDISIKPTQKYALLLVENSCGDMSVKNPGHTAYFRVCLKTDDKGQLKLDLERKTRDGNDEVEVHASVNATPKTTYTITDMKVTFD